MRKLKALPSVADRVEQRVIARMRALRAKGKTLRDIADELNDKAITTRRGTAWHHVYVAGVLKGPPSNFRPYSVEYRYNGALWSFELLATSHEDAEERLKAIAWAKVGGEIIERIPAAPGVHWYMRLRCWLASLR